VLYRLPEILEADHVHVNEGEKAADALAEAGHCATCPPTSRWTTDLVEPLRGKAVTLWVDRDEEGRKKARKAIDALSPLVKSLRVVAPKVTTEKADAFDHLAAGYPLDQAVELDRSSLHEVEVVERLRLLTAEEYATDVAPAALIEGLLFVGSTTLLTGASNSGKSGSPSSSCSALSPAPPSSGWRAGRRSCSCARSNSRLGWCANAWRN
jgi:hypothetical protein